MMEVSLCLHGILVGLLQSRDSPPHGASAYAHVGSLRLTALSVDERVAYPVTMHQMILQVYAFVTIGLFVCYTPYKLSRTKFVSCGATATV